MNTRELQEAVNEYQTEELYNDDEMLESEGSFMKPKKSTATARISQPVSVGVDTSNPFTRSLDDEDSRSAYEDYINRIMNAPIGSGTYEDLTDEAVRAGFGTSRYDSSYVPGMDLEDSRAKARSGFANVMAGLLKGGVRTIGTAINTTAGTLVGLGSGIAELFLDMDNDGKRGLGEIFDAATNNWVSSQIVKLEDEFERIVPNYRTAQERTEEYQKHWYYPSHIFSSNAIGDFLSNLGFTAGAMLGGVGVSKFLGRIKSKQLANDILKSSVMAAEGDANAKAELSNIAQSLRNGSIQMIDPSKLSDNLKMVASRINNTEARLQLYGAAIGAIGEGTTEGIMAKNEFLDDYSKRAQDKFNSKYQALEEELLEEGDSRYVNQMALIDADGIERVIPVLNSDGAAELERRRKNAIDEYRAEMNEAGIQADRLASITQLLNFPVLTTTNMMFYGRMLSGGWKTSRRNAGKISGKAKVGKGRISGEYKGIGKWKPTIVSTLKTMAGEGSEEMLQGAISSGEKVVAEERMASFNDAGYDSEVIQGLSSMYLKAFKQGAVDYLGDIKNWNEGFMGAITGLLGVPGRRWGGGFIGAYQDAKEKSKVSMEAANNLNSLVNSSEFQNRWRGFIRHMSYDNDLRNAVAEDDQYAWHTADDNQLISDVISFADAGRINDLESVINYYKNLSGDDINNIRQVLSESSDKNGSNDWIVNASDEEIISRVKDQAKKIEDTVKLYREIYDAVSSIAPHDASPEYLRELVATSMQIEKYDERFLRMLNDVMPHIDAAALALSTLDENNNIRTPEQIKSESAKIKSAYESLIAGELAPVELPEKFRKIQEGILDEIEDVVKSDSETLKKVQDMRKVSEARKRFYRKLKNLRTEGGRAEFEANHASQNSVNDAAEIAVAALETNNINSLSDVKKAYFEKNAKERDEFINTLRSVVNKKPEVQNFLDIIDKFSGFVEYVNKHNPDFSSNPLTNPAMVMNMLEDIPRRAQNVDDVEKLPDTVFQDLATFTTQNNSAFGLPIGESEYEATKGLIRGMMKAYVGLDSDTASRNMSHGTDVQATTVPANTETPTGRDASQGGSVTQMPKKAEKDTSKTATGAVDGVAEESKKKSGEASGEVTPTKPEVNEVEEESVVNQTQSERSTDFVDNSPVESKEVVASESKETDGKKTYYRTSVPEIDSKEAAAARDALTRRDAAAYHSADLSDFVISHPEYAPIWNALHDRGAFEYVANKLNVGDKIKFIIDPSFPQYKGKPQILIATEVDGKNQILSVLSLKSDDYFGLKELRDQILKEYNSFKKNNPNDVFEFGKQSTVWCKRDGLIEYSDTLSDKSIVDIPGYSEDSPIVFIDGNGNAIFVRGKDSGLPMPDKFLNNANNTGADGSGNDRRGHLYYLVNSGTGHSIPIRLNVEHFSESKKDKSSKMFDDIRSLISEIANIASTANNTNLKEVGSALSNKVSELAKLLDLHDVDFVLREWDDIGVALAINTRDAAGEIVADKSKMFRPEQIKIEKVIDFISSLDKSLNIKYSPTTHSLTNLDDLISSGEITSNAKMLRAKGVDFYCDPYNPESGEFMKIEPVTPAVKPQSAVVAPENDTFNGNGVEGTEFDEELDESLTDSSKEDIDFDEVDDDAGYSDATARKARNDAVAAVEQEALGGTEMPKHINSEFSELPEDTKKLLIEKGYSEDEWSGMSDMLRERVLRCLK